MAKATRQTRAVHPGEVLQKEFLEPEGKTASDLARLMEVPPNRVSMIIAGKRSVTPATAVMLAKALGTTAEFWLNLQQSYELRRANGG